MKIKCLHTHFTAACEHFYVCICVTWAQINFIGCAHLSNFQFFYSSAWFFSEQKSSELQKSGSSYQAGFRGQSSLSGCFRGQSSLSGIISANHRAAQVGQLFLSGSRGPFDLRQGDKWLTCDWLIWYQIEMIVIPDRDNCPWGMPGSCYQTFGIRRTFAPKKNRRRSKKIEKCLSERTQYLLSRVHIKISDSAQTDTYWIHGGST